MCMFGVLTLCIFEYVWCIYDAIFAKKCIFVYAFGTCVSPRRIFFTPWEPVSCAGVFLFYACVEIGLARLLRVYFLTRTLHFWTAPVETKITFLLQV